MNDKWNRHEFGIPRMSYPFRYGSVAEGASLPTALGREKARLSRNGGPFRYGSVAEGTSLPTALGREKARLSRNGGPFRYGSVAEGASLPIAKQRQENVTSWNFSFAVSNSATKRGDRLVSLSRIKQDCRTTSPRSARATGCGTTRRQACRPARRCGHRRNRAGLEANWREVPGSDRHRSSSARH